MCSGCEWVSGVSRNSAGLSERSHMCEHTRILHVILHYFSWVGFVVFVVRLLCSYFTFLLFISCTCTPEWYGPHCTSRYDDCAGGGQDLCVHGVCIDSDRVNPNEVIQNYVYLFSVFHMHLDIKNKLLICQYFDFFSIEQKTRNFRGFYSS